MGRGGKNRADPSMTTHYRNTKLLGNTADAAGQFKRHKAPGLIWPCQIFVWGQEAEHHHVLERFPPKGPQAWF